MMPVNANICVDPTLMKDAQALFESLGLSLNSAIDLFLRQSVREQGLPFQIRHPLPNTETLQAIEDTRNGIGLSRSFSSVAELMEDLDADD